MKIAALHFYNFKGFKGLHKIEGLDKGLSDDQNIVLVGAYNGAGKTSFLETLFLCFYGNAANKLYPSRGASRETYNSFIAALLNNDVRSQGSLNAQMHLEVFLKDVELAANFTRDISLKRSWEFTTQGGVLDPSETFQILENGRPIQDLEPSEYAERIQGVLPYNVSQFFFFDGEKIQDFASDTDNEFASSLKDVLGITTYSVLAEDLKKVRSRIVTDYNKNKDSKVKITEKQLEKERLERRIEDNRIQITELEDSITDLEVESEKLKGETKRATRISVTSREQYQEKKEELKEEKETLEREYVEQSKDFLPFILTFPLCLQIEETLIQEEKVKGKLASQREVEPKIQQIVDGVLDESVDEIKLKPAQVSFLRYKIDHVIREFLLQGQVDDVDEDELIHNLSAPDSQKIQTFIRNLKDLNVQLLHTKASRLKEIEYTLDRISKTEVRAGDGSQEVQDLLDRIKMLGVQIGEKRRMVDDLVHTNKEHVRNIGFLTRDITNHESEAQLSDAHQKQINYCERMVSAIKEFQRKYQARRTHELEASIKDMWNRLAHKSNFVKDIKVLPESNFEVKMYDGNNSEIDKTKMSAGEREIYAISLLWALVHVSGKRLPIVIDTPFGRLDSQHRRNLVENYFPKASHQVILLSHDEEIVGDYYRAIRPNISTEFTIKSADGQSQILDGYPFAPEYS